MVEVKKVEEALAWKERNKTLNDRQEVTRKELKARRVTSKIFN